MVMASPLWGYLAPHRHVATVDSITSRTVVQTPASRKQRGRPVAWRRGSFIGWPLADVWPAGYIEGHQEQRRAADLGEQTRDWVGEAGDHILTVEGVRNA